MRRSIFQLVSLTMCIGLIVPARSNGQSRLDGENGGRRQSVWRQYGSKWNQAIKRLPANKKQNQPISMRPFVPRDNRSSVPTTGHKTQFGTVTGLVGRQSRKSNNVPRGSGIFNYEYGFVNPYYPSAWNSPQIRPSSWDGHEGWVSKYLYSKPAVSPYMELFRHDITLVGATRYEAFVRPQLDEFYGISSPPNRRNGRIAFSNGNQTQLR